MHIIMQWKKTINTYEKIKASQLIYSISTEIDTEIEITAVRVNRLCSNMRLRIFIWRQLVKCNKEKLSYASTSLKMNKMDVESTFMQEYSDLLEKKNLGQLHVVK